MQLGKFFALLGAVFTFMAIGAGSALAVPSGVSVVGGSLVLTEFEPDTLTYVVTKQATDGTGGRLFAFKGQVSRVFSGGGKVGVATEQEITVKGKETVKTAVWDITTPNSPAIVARATYVIKKGSRGYGCGSEVDLLGISSAGEFVVRSAKRQRHKKASKCTPEYLAKKRKMKNKARNRITITLIGAVKTVVQRHSLRAPEGNALTPLMNVPDAKAAGTRLVSWDEKALSIRELTRNAKPISYKFDRGVQAMSVDIGESGTVVAAGTAIDRKGFLVTGKTRTELPIEFSGESYLCGDRIVEIARSPIVVDGRVTNELAAIEWSLQGALLKKTSIGSNHFIASFGCDAATAYGIRQTVPAKTPQLITIKLG